ncbi:uncharacterized protein LOC129847625 [Salvelinus fontinalis]|uniref:uncharacterized protein LOC129847625 n=1 Tax=Salvelinus fontinalis TaxID=8038 RepID=UPI002484DD52|nr:uncharacterized protein LOC129847625 [Salvelinus fontinalis]XP_055771351.1 uncharacterized protein LOC129847625 [Salvelinus fontinalis]XP_055771352.1 uncharacterized protein LOC129847625 [Salvelinus fontinalis]
MDVKMEDDEAESSQVTIWSDSINACIDYPHSPVSGNTETSYLETKTNSTYKHDYTVIQTTNNLSDSYFPSEIDVKLEENDMGITPTVPWSSCSYVGLPKEHSHVPSISSQTTSQGQILRLFPEKTGTSDGENNAVKVVYFCNAQDPVSTSEGHFLKEESWHGSPSSDIPIANAFTLCGSFEAQINPSSQVFSVNQTQTNNELPLPAENVHLARYSTDITSVLTSPATESGCNLAVSTRSRPILSDYCEPFNFPSDEDEDYNGDGRRRLQCQKTVEDEYIRQCRVSYSRKTPRHFGTYWKAPYKKCKEMGVVFNVGSGVKQKLDRHLLTNGVMVEVSEYAKEIKRAHRHVIYDILEYNFDLGVGSELQFDFGSRIMLKLKEMMKKKYKRTQPGWLAEVFELPDPKTMKATNYSRQWARSNLHNSVSKNLTPFDICIKEEPVVDLISPPHVKTESLFTETVLTRCADETALFGPENGPHEICTKDEADLAVIYPQHVQTESVFTQTDITMEESLMMPTLEEALEYLYPLCKEKGLDLDVKSKCVKKEKLDLHLLTRDVMFEVADFASDVCGNCRQIVCDVLDQNFDLDLQSGKTELAEEIMDALRILKKKPFLRGEKRCAFDKDTFLKKRRRRKNPAEICSNQNFTTASLELKYRRRKEVTKRRRLDLMRKKKEMDMLLARVSKGGDLLEVRQVEPHWVKLESISDKIDLALCADETKQNVINLDHSNVTFNTKELVKDCYPLCHEIGLGLDVASKPAFTHCGYFEAQINPTSQVFSVNQTQTNIELPLPAENVHLARYSTAVPSVLTSPATESGCNLAVSTRPRPILSDYCEPFNFPSDEDEDYNGDGRRRLQCQKTVEDEYIRQCRVSYSRKTPRHYGRNWKAPYKKCKEMGVDFNVGSGVKQKLDRHLLTNGVMVEVSEYAREIKTAQPRVIYDILEYNFDLGVGNEVQYTFSVCTMAKLKDMKKNYKKKQPGWLAEVFELPDPKTMKASNRSLTWARSFLHDSVSENRTPFDICIKEEPVVDLISPPHVKTENLFTETVLTRCADETALFGPENGPHEICTKDEADLAVIYPQHVQTESVFTQKDIKMEESLMMPTIEEALEYLYPLCKEKGLDLDVKSKCVKKEKLDLHLLTRDVMFEVADFSSEVCGNYRQIVCDVLDQNFDLDLQSGKTELAQEIMVALRAVWQRKTRLHGRYRCEFYKDTFMKKRRKQRNSSEFSNHQKATTVTLEPKYQRLKEVTKRRRLAFMRKRKEMDMLLARVSKGGDLLEVRQVEPHWVKLESISDKIDLALCADETKQNVTNLDHSNVTFNTKELVKDCYPLCHEIGLGLDVASKPAFTHCGYFEAQINPTSQVFSINQTQTNIELPLPAENVHLARYTTAVPSVLTSPATESGCNLAVSTRPRPILSDYCEPFNFPSDEDEDYNGDRRLRLQCQKAVEDKYIRQWRVSYSKHNPRDCGKYWKAPYTKCKEIGVDFNVGSGVKQKLDRHLLTNGVMVEVAEYAKAIKSAEQRVIYDILEYNFDLGVCNEVQYTFSARSMAKLKDMKKNYKKIQPGWLAEVFELPDPKTMKASNLSLTWERSNLHDSVSENRTPFDICIKDEPVVDLISPPHVKTESLFTETVLTRCADETALFGPENGPHEICTKDEADLAVIYPQHVQTESVFTQTDITMKESLMMPTLEEALEYLYPLCKEKGLDLDVKSKCVKKEKLDLHLLTRDVMFEVADFASEVCGNYRQIVCDVLDQNFDLDLQSGKTELAQEIMDGLGMVWMRKTHLHGRKRCEFYKDTFMKKRCKQKNSAEFSNHQKATTVTLEPKYQRLKEVTKRRRLALMMKKKRNGHVNSQGVEGRRFAGSQTSRTSLGQAREHL